MPKHKQSYAHQTQVPVDKFEPDSSLVTDPKPVYIKITTSCFILSVVVVREVGSLLLVATFPPAIPIVLRCSQGVELEAIYAKPKIAVARSSIVPVGKEMVWQLN